MTKFAKKLTVLLLCFLLLAPAGAFAATNALEPKSDSLESIVKGATSQIGSDLKYSELLESKTEEQIKNDTYLGERLKVYTNNKGYLNENYDMSYIPIICGDEVVDLVNIAYNNMINGEPEISYGDYIGRDLKYLSKAGIKEFYLVIDVGVDTRYVTDKGTISSSDFDIIHLAVIEKKITEDQAISQVALKLDSSDKAEKQVESYVNQSKDKIIKSKIIKVTKLYPEPSADGAKKNIAQVMGNWFKETLLTAIKTSLPTS